MTTKPEPTPETDAYLNAAYGGYWRGKENQALITANFAFDLERRLAIANRRVAELRHDIERSVATNAELATERDELKRKNEVWEIILNLCTEQVGIETPYGEIHNSIAELKRQLAEVRDAISGDDYSSLPSDITLVRMAHTIRADHDKFRNQVRDTCARAERAEEEVARLTHNHRIQDSTTAAVMEKAERAKAENAKLREEVKNGDIILRVPQV